MNKKANAQQGFSVSVKTTPQFSFLQNKDDRDNSSIEQKATVNANFGIGAGLQLSHLACRCLAWTYCIPCKANVMKLTEYEANRKVDYVKIPVYFTYNRNPDKPVSFIGKIGPQVSVLTNSKLTDNNGHTLKSNTNNFYKDVTFGGMAAGGAQFKLDRRLFLTTMARFDYDFTNAEDHTNPYYPAGRTKTHNMTTGMEVGLKYML